MEETFSVRPIGRVSSPRIDVIDDDWGPIESTIEPVSVDGLRVTVRGLDAIHNTPVLDIKPHVVEFPARGEARQPSSMAELMPHYG